MFPIAVECENGYGRADNSEVGEDEDKDQDKTSASNRIGTVPINGVLGNRRHILSTAC